MKAQSLAGSYFWTALGDGIRQILGFAVSLILARLLAPSDYGLIGMVLVFVSVLSSVQEAGPAQAVIRFGKDPAAFPLCAFTGAALGLIMALVLFTAAPAVAAFYALPALEPVVRTMSCVLLFNGLRSASQGELLRGFQFKRVTLIETVAGLVGAAVAVALAAAGFGVWALVANLVSASVLQAALVLRAAPPRYAPLPGGQLTRRILAWSLPALGAVLLWQLYINADSFIIGKLLGSEQLGYYAIAFRLAMLLNDRLGAVVSRVSFSSLSAMQDETERAAAHWLALLERMSLVTYPFLAFLYLCREEVILVLLGAKWLPAADPLRYLAIGAAFRSISPVTVNFLATQGYTRWNFVFSLLNALLLPAGFWWGATTMGVSGVALAWVMVFPLPLLVVVSRASLLPGAGWRRFVASLKRPLALLAFVSLSISAAHWLSPPGAVTRLLLSGAGLAAGVLLFLALAPRLREELRAILLKIFRPQ
ncbi:MAG: oligosaccharide flippase family protein [Bryobacteraceae bacterium]|nr:oligosaccharide flippase family protein [Bryobacteraceae bacterium]